MHRHSSTAGEIEEMIEIYQDRGFSEEEATKIIGIMSKHSEFFVDHMMVEVWVAVPLCRVAQGHQELGLLPIDEDESPLKQGIVMFFSFLGFGFVPLFCLQSRAF